MYDEDEHFVRRMQNIFNDWTLGLIYASSNFDGIYIYDPTSVIDVGSGKISPYHSFNLMLVGQFALRNVDFYIPRFAPVKM